MKRLFPRVAVAGSALGLVVLAAGCAPKNEVKPGAPVLSKFTIVESGGAATDITSEATACAAGAVEGGDCVGVMADVDGGTVNVDATCKLTDTYCHCVAKADGDPTIVAMKPETTGSWICHYAPMSVVIAIFDRLLDTAPLDPGDASALEGIATLTATPAPATPLTTMTDYASNGSTIGIVFPLFGPAFFGNYRVFGPSLAIAAQPALPSAATVAFALNKTKVLAKDGKTAFVATGLIQDGLLSFATNAFSASITVPQPAPPDDGGVPATTVPPDMAAVTITFNNAVDAATIASHISVTAGGAPFTAFTVDTSMAPVVTVTPTTTWTPSTTFVVTVDATAADLTGVALGTAVVSDPFTTSAM